MAHDKEKVGKYMNLIEALRVLKPYIQKGRPLQTGRGIPELGGMLPREMLSNWLLCVAVNSVTSPERLGFVSVPAGTVGDGIIRDHVGGGDVLTEHVMVPELEKNTGRAAEELILEAVNHKVMRGPEYAAGKTLVVLLFQGTEIWYPNRVSRLLPIPILFDAVWVTGLQGVLNRKYLYNVTRLEQPHSPVWRVHINENFDGWSVEHVQ